MLLSIVLSVVIFCIVTAIEGLFTDGKGPVIGKDKNGKRVSASYNGIIKGLVIGLVVGLVNYFAPKVSGAIWLAPIFLIAMLAVSGYLIWWWKKEGNDWRELIAFVVLTVLIYFTIMSAAAMTTGIEMHPFLVSLILLLPKLVLISSIGFFLADMCFFNRDRANRREETDKAKSLNILGWIVAIATVVILFFLCYSNLAWETLKFDFNRGEEEAEETNLTWYGFYNPSMLRDDIEGNDYDFGYNLVDFFEAEDEEEEPIAADFDQDLRERMAVDPKLGAAVMAWMDANVGTRYLGTFYEECKGEWASTMNTAAERWMENEEEYLATLDAFFGFLDNAEDVTLKTGKGITDQMYMNPFTVSGVPDIIVMETDQEEGLFLVYELRIKGNIFEVMYRTDCGYQPTNVEKVMNITPQPNPNKPAPQPSKPNPTPTPTQPSNPKDPSKGTQGPLVGPNDDPGPGPDTNNGEGAWFSSEQEEDGSIFLPSYQEYEEIMDELEDINETQREGGDDNTPTYTPPEDKYGTDVNVDSNAENGTGYGGIDVSTPVTPPAQTTGGKSVTNDGPGEAWGGPPD